MTRRRLLAGIAGATAIAGAAAAGIWWPGAASAADNGNGLTVVDSGEINGRLSYYRFSTTAIGWNPAVNVLLPDGYHDGDARYPVLYLLHGGNEDFRTFDTQHDIQKLTAGRDLIVVMPDASTGWYSDPVSSNLGPRNWETFHIDQLLPWIDANFRTHPDARGRAVAGFSMGGFGSLKYAARHRDLFCSVSAHSGPPSLRRDAGLVVHWANATSAALDLGGATVYGVPADDERIDADNPMHHLTAYADKRIFLVAGTSPDPINLFDEANETEVLAGQREFRAALDAAGTAYEAHERPGGHVFRHDMFAIDLDGMLQTLRPAA